MNTLHKSRFAFFAGLLLLLLAAMLPLLHIYARALSNQVLMIMARHESLQWSQIFTREADKLERLLDGGPIPPAVADVLTSAGKVAEISHYAFYDTDGALVSIFAPGGSFDSYHDHGKLPLDTMKSLWLNQPTVMLIREQKFNNDIYLATTFVPISTNGALRSVTEIEVDVTHQGQQIDRIISSIALAGGTVVGIIGALLLGLIYMRRNEVRSARSAVIRLNRLDKLTNTFNHSTFVTTTAERLTEAAAAGHRTTVICVDICRFKMVNESFGLAAGDRLLQEFADRLRIHLRESDSLARLNADEFAILLPKVSPDADIPAIVRRIKRAMAEPFTISGNIINLTVCIGVSTAPEDTSDAETLLNNAKVALRHAKRDGRGCMRVFASSMNLQWRDGLLLESELARAIDSDAIDVHFQPQIDIESGQIVCCEALVRWQHPTLGQISPARFIPLAEDSGLIFPLSERVLRRACEQAMLWPVPIPVAVNLSPAQLPSGTLPSLVTDVLKATGLPADRLELEVTEGMIMDRSDVTMTTLHSLRELGIGIAIDDFGTGYSNLSHLAHFPFTKLKIDRAFVTDIGRDRSISAIVEAIVSMGRALNVKVITEGVETKAQLERLRRTGCRLVQGYYFSKPLPQSELIAFLQARVVQPVKLHG